MNEYTHLHLAHSRNAELAAKARTTRPNSTNAPKTGHRSWFARIAKPLALADVR